MRYIRNIGKAFCISGLLLVGISVFFAILLAATDFSEEMFLKVRMIILFALVFIGALIAAKNLGRYALLQGLAIAMLFGCLYYEIGIVTAGSCAASILLKRIIIFLFAGILGAIAGAGMAEND